MTVDVILKTKIEGLGSEADVVSVKPGYARNFLIPKDFAAPATLATKRQVEELAANAPSARRRSSTTRRNWPASSAS